jgi:formiminoglutamase
MKSNLGTSNSWSGRVDGIEPEQLRWHQVVKHIHSDELITLNDQWILLGFAGDQGVKRNLGRVGARDGPEAIRCAASVLPVPKQGFNINDLGNFLATEELESDQELFSEFITAVHASNNRTVVLGGGHEITYPHYLGLKKAFPDKRIGIINIDAHYDIRDVNPGVGATSGTGFYQILSEYPDTGYLILGVNEASNTEILKQRAHKFGVKQLSIFDVQLMPVEDVLYQVRMFAQDYEILYLTMCMDAFSSAFAPGVSAPAAFGIVPDARFFTIFKEIHRLNKIHAFDIAEVNPSLDQDSRTSKLAAQLLYYWLA